MAVTPASGDTDIAGYRYGFDNSVALWAPADSNGAATIPITLWSDPFFPGNAIADLWVKAVDRAGNEQATVTGPRSVAATETAATPSGVPGDVNGDGTADVTAVLDMDHGRTAAWNFFSSTTGFHPPTIGWDSSTNGGYTIDRVKTASGDFDGDGRTDLALFRQDPDGYVRLATLPSDTNRYVQGSEVDAGTWRLADARIFAGDFTGDGHSDVAAIVDDRAGGWKAYVYPATGSGFTISSTPWYTQTAGTYSWTATKMVAGDFTGDGRTDLAVAQDTTGSRTTLHVHTSTGSALSAGSLWWDSDTDTNPATFTGTAAKYAVADVAGSTADDIVAMYNHGARTTVEVLTTQTATFAAPQTWWDSDTGSDDGWEWRNTRQLTTGDFDADGEPDLAAVVNCCEPGNRQLWTFTHNGSAFGEATLQGNATATDARPTTARWSTNEGAGSYLSDSDGNSPASVTGATWATSGPVIGSNVLSFDGVNDHASPGRHLVDTTRSFTVAAWVKLDNTTDYRTILSQDGTYRSGFYLQYGAGTWRFVVASADSAGTVDYYAARHTAAPRTGVWTHLTGVYDADAQQLKLYLNGALTGAASRPTAWTATGPLQIGRAHNGSTGSSNWWAGDVTDIRVYDDALVPTDIVRLAHQVTPAGHWMFDNATDPTGDGSGNDRTLTLHGATTGNPGHSGEGLTLNGTTQYASAPTALDPTVGYTVCGWAKLNSGVDLTYRTILSQEATRSSSFWLRTGPTGKWQFIIATSDSSYTTVDSTTSAAANTWQHVCGAYDFSRSRLLVFVNGKLEAVTTLSSAPVAATGPINIGRYKYLDNHGGNFAGSLDDIRIYTGVILDPRQITQIMSEH